MSIGSNKGTPFVGTVSLTNGVPGPTAFSLIVARNQNTPYTLNPNERISITNIVISSNDTANPLVSITDAAATPTTLFKAYTASAIPTTASYIPGVLLGALATIPKASAPAVTTAKTVEIVINGVIYREGA